MAPPLLFDISTLDFAHPMFDTQGVEQVNPHRGHMRLIDAVVYHHELETVAYKDVRHDEFWVQGHIPGRPVFPGVLMIEAAAQVASFISLLKLGGQSFMGFAGVDDVKFRGQVVPGDRLIILCKELEFRPRRCICATQGLVNGNLVFEATITGMPM
jgi:3-hydroxyacyl-[acyl-carrier-protein] dehydratase